jgi:CheY-like chemotaxis protein
MPDGGHLFVDFNNISSEPSADSLHGNDHAEYIRITFQDEGTGIDPKNLDRIFDPYFSTKQTGSGLGLATVFSIITKHGGNISVESEQGKGTKFILHIPASKNKPVSDLKNNLMKPVTEAKGGRILVMDDEEILCDVISKMLTAGGFSVLTTSTGESAIAEYQKAMEKGMPYDAVIMDLTIPGGMGGKEAIKDILALNPDARVIVSSGYADDPVMANYSDYGFKGIIAKPYTMGNLQKVMDTLLAQ